LPGRFRVGVDLIAGVAGETNERLEFGLERAADPSLYVPAQVSLNLVTNPLAPGAALLSPTVLLKEESYSSPLGAVSVSPGELKNASGDLVGIQIQPARATPIEVPSGRSAELTLALSATPSPGVYTSRVSLHSPELRQTVNMDVTLKVRVASVFLLLILVGGVALGWGVNVVLAGRAKLDAALLEALRAADGLVKRAQAQQDPAVQQRILRVAAGLEAALGQAQTVENVQDLVKTAQGQVSAIEAQAATDAKNLAPTRARRLIPWLKICCAACAATWRGSRPLRAQGAPKRLRVSSLPSICTCLVPQCRCSIRGSPPSMARWASSARGLSPMQSLLRPGMR
jgi:hypothetical protein